MKRQLNKLWLFLLIFLYGSAQAQENRLQPYFAAVIVANIDSSIAWYNSMFNLKLRNRVDNSAREFKQAILINNDIMIELVELTKGIPKDSLLKNYPSGSQSLGLNKFGFIVADIEALHHLLEAKKANFAGRMVGDAISKKRTFLIRDPDGNLLQFFER